MGIIDFAYIWVMKSVFLSNLHHAYAQTDGSYAFPNSREGDMLKTAKHEIEALHAELELAQKFHRVAVAERDHAQYQNSRTISEELLTQIATRCRAAAVSSVYAATHHGMGFLLAKEAEGGNKDGIVFRDDSMSQADRQRLAVEVNLILEKHQR